VRLLLDTHLLLWSAVGSDRLGATARQLIEDPGNTPVFSVASIWETAIKYGLGRDDFDIEPRQLRRGLIENGYEELAIASDHVMAVGQLPQIHHDPFDRLLLAQAMVEGMILLTSDDRVATYPAPVRRV
jgi:PIN domain nuclease of toxin-antitoxin system